MGLSVGVVAATIETGNAPGRVFRSSDSNDCWALRGCRTFRYLSPLLPMPSIIPAAATCRS
eukprot:1122596-Alexandrium_andersonii.AAC.1